MMPSSWSLSMAVTATLIAGSCAAPPLAGTGSLPFSICGTSTSIEDTPHHEHNEHNDIHDTENASATATAATGGSSGPPADSPALSLPASSSPPFELTGVSPGQCVLTPLPPNYHQACLTWSRLRDNTEAEIRERLVRDGECDEAGEMAHRLHELINSPRGEEVVDQLYWSVCLQTGQLCARMSIRHRPRDGCELDGPEQAVVHEWEASLYQVATMQARIIHNVQEWQAAYRDQIRRSSPRGADQRRVRRRVSEAPQEEDADWSALVGASRVTSRTPRRSGTTPTTSESSRATAPTASSVTVTETTIWLTPRGALRHPPSGMVEGSGPTCTDLLGLSSTSPHSLPTMIPESMQQDILRTVGGMGQRARGLMARSLPQCLNLVQDEIQQIIRNVDQGGDIGPPTTPAASSSHRPSSSTTRGRTEESSDMVIVHLDDDEDTDSSLYIQALLDYIYATDQDNNDNTPRDYEELLDYLYALDQNNNDSMPRDYQNRGNRLERPQTQADEDDVARDVQAASQRLDLARNSGGGNGALLRAFKCLVDLRDIDSYRLYAEPFLQWISARVQDPECMVEVPQNRQWAEWAEPLLWEGWLSHHQPDPEVIRSRPFVGIFAAVDGILPGQNTYRARNSSAEAILAAHAVADGGDDTVTENNNQDAAFVEQWWAVLRPLLPAPQAVTLSGVIALVDSVEEEKTQQHGLDNATGEKGDNTPSRSSTQAWHEVEELKAYQADEARMLEYWDDLDRQEAEAKRRASEARAWDDWALHDSMYPTFEDDIHGSQPTSSHEVHVPSAGVIQILLMPAENPPDLDSEASTAVVGQGTGWPSGVLQAPLAESLPASSPVLPMGHGVDTECPVEFHSSEIFGSEDLVEGGAQAEQLLDEGVPLVLIRKLADCLVVPNGTESRDRHWRTGDPVYANHGADHSSSLEANGWVPGARMNDRAMWCAAEALLEDCLQRPL
eukprot:s86_g15.t2